MIFWYHFPTSRPVPSRPVPSRPDEHDHHGHHDHHDPGNHDDHEEVGDEHKQVGGCLLSLKEVGGYLTSKVEKIKKPQNKQEKKSQSKKNYSKNDK